VSGLWNKNKPQHSESTLKIYPTLQKWQQMENQFSIA
jgi:hypothetical protein